MTKLYNSIHVDKETSFELHNTKDSMILFIDHGNAVMVFLDAESLNNLKLTLNNFKHSLNSNENPTETTDKNSKT